VNPNINQALQLTAVGMGLVILALLIIAVLIMLLRSISGRVAAKTAEDGDDDDADELPAAPAFAAEAAADHSDEAAAITLALHLARQPRMGGISRRAITYTDVEVIGEVVPIIAVEPENAAWGNAGRLQSTR